MRSKPYEAKKRSSWTQSILQRFMLIGKGTAGPLGSKFQCFSGIDNCKWFVLTDVQYIINQLELAKFHFAVPSDQQLASTSYSSIAPLSWTYSFSQLSSRTRARVSGGIRRLRHRHQVFHDKCQSVQSGSRAHCHWRYLVIAVFAQQRQKTVSLWG